jgi:serine phosphatase RsbU (regulator of sigma subunit)
MTDTDKSSFDPFFIIARFFRRDLDRYRGDERAGKVVTVIGVLVNLPLAIAGLAWLASVTDWTVFIRRWPFLLLIAALIVLLSQLRFYLIVPLGATGEYGNAAGTLEGVVKWSAIFLVGAPVLWIDLLVTLVTFLADKSYRQSVDTRWNLTQNIIASTAQTAFLQLVTLTVYQAIGGGIPIAGLSPRTLLLGLAAIVLQLFLDMLLLWVNYLGYILWAMRKTLAPHLRLSLPVLLFMGLVIPCVANLFAVPLAGVYAQHGLLFYLVFVLAFVLVGLLARQMSQATEESRAQSVQLEKLEALGRAILNAPPDASTLPKLLTEHAPAMFLHTHMDIWVGDWTLLAHPAEWAAGKQNPIRTWVTAQTEAHCFTLKDPLPWETAGIRRPAIAAPILDDESGQPIGGIYVDLASMGHTQDCRALHGLLPSLQGLAAQVASALHQAKAYKETLAHQKTQQELAVARQIQTSFLPHNLPQIPGWDLSASLEPAREMAGDFYDLIPLPDDHLGILIADVADKGVGPALYMALSRTLVRTFAAQYPDQPEKVLRYANERILQDADYGLFVTTFYGVLNPRTGELIYANAGHNPPWVFDSAKPDPDLLTRTGMALGVDDSVTWTKASVKLAPGNIAFFYTDGATDAQNTVGELFDEKRLLEAVQANRSRPAADLRAAVVEEIRSFTGDAPQFDDITLIIVKRD